MLFQSLLVLLLIEITGFECEEESTVVEVLRGGTPHAVLILLFSFLGYFAALAIALFALHRRSVLSLVGSVRQAFEQGGKTIVLLALVSFVFFFLPLNGEFELKPALDLEKWLGLLPVALLGIAIQISGEELVFRGYLQSYFAAWLRHPLFWIGIPSVLFGLLHLSPESYGPNAWIVVVWASLFGVMLGDITARAGTLGPALAIHFINNISAILLAAPQGHLDGLALYQFPFSFHDPEAFRAWMPVEFLYMLCTWLCARLALRR